MKEFRSRDLLVVFFVGVLLIGTGLSDAFARAEHTEQSADTVRTSPWLLVNLSRSRSYRGGGAVYNVIKQLSGNPNGMVLPFDDVTAELLAEKQPAFIILSPQGTPWCRYSGSRGVKLQNFLWSIPVAAEIMNIPILGICGGHQALALAFGGKVGPIRGGEDDCLPYNRMRQSGVVPLDMETHDPLFRGLGSKLRIVQSHYDEVKVLPPGFVLLASDDTCPVQIMRHPSKPVYGIQGHPERFSASRPDGGILIRNFLKIARTHNMILRRVSLSVPPKLLSFHQEVRVTTRTPDSSRRCSEQIHPGIEPRNAVLPWSRRNAWGPREE